MNDQSDVRSSWPFGLQILFSSLAVILLLLMTVSTSTWKFAAGQLIDIEVEWSADWGEEGESEKDAEENESSEKEGFETDDFLDRFALLSKDGSFSNHRFFMVDRSWEAIYFDLLVPPDENVS